MARLRFSEQNFSFAFNPSLQVFHFQSMLRCRSLRASHHPIPRCDLPMLTRFFRLSVERPRAIVERAHTADVIFFVLTSTSPYHRPSAHTFILRFPPDRRALCRAPKPHTEIYFGITPHPKLFPISPWTSSLPTDRQCAPSSTAPN